MASLIGDLSSRIPSKEKGEVPFLDLRPQFAIIKDEIMAAIARVMEQQQFILGREVEEFEKQLATALNVQWAITCASGSDALLLALMALGIAPGDEVITTPFTFVATAGSIARLGARPVFVDIEPETYNLNPNQIAAAITPRTRVIIPVHLFGLVADMDRITAIADQHGLHVVEDAAQAIGAYYHGKPAGSLGIVGCFSFFPSKNLGGAGDGGLMVTNDAALADRLRVLRNHGSSEKYHYEMLGVNSRLDALQAAILGVKLKYLSRWTEARREHAARYRRLFSDRGLQRHVRLPEEKPGFFHVYNQFTIRVKSRDELRVFLKGNGVSTEVYYPLPLHVQSAFKYLGHSDGDFPNAEDAAREVLTLPIYPELEPDQQELVVARIAEFFGVN